MRPTSASVACGMRKAARATPPRLPLLPFPLAQRPAVAIGRCRDAPALCHCLRGAVCLREHWWDVRFSFVTSSTQQAAPDLRDSRVGAGGGAAGWAGGGEGLGVAPPGGQGERERSRASAPVHGAAAARSTATMARRKAPPPNPRDFLETLPGLMQKALPSGKLIGFPGSPKWNSKQGC